MIDERELRALRLAPAPVPDLDGVVRRGTAIRRRRRRRRGAAAAGAAVAIAAVVTALAPTDDRTGVELAAPVDVPAGVDSHDDAGNCGGYAELRDAAEAGVPRLMPGWLPDGLAIGDAWARAELTEALTCPPVPTALVAARRGADGTVVAGFRLEGPAPEPYRAYDGPTHVPTPVRGDAEARLVRFPSVDDGLRQVQWTEPGSGTSWSLTAVGLVDAEVLAVVAALELDGAGGGPVAQLPAELAGTTGLEVLWALDERPGPLPAEQPFWHVVIDDGQTLSIDVTRPLVPTPAIAAVAAPGTRTVVVRGQVGVLHEGPVSASVTWDEDGLRIGLSGRLGVADLLRIAESLVPVPPDDPRIGLD